MNSTFHSGFITLTGRSNVGKSTLLNALVGEKVAIVSDRPQTTRNTIRGVVNGEGYQMVIVDTPGLLQPRTRLGEYMVKSVRSALEGVDAVMAVFDASEPMLAGDRAQTDRIRAALGGKQKCCFRRHPVIGIRCRKVVQQAGPFRRFEQVVAVVAAGAVGAERNAHTGFQHLRQA